MGYDEVISILGGFSKYQRKIYFLLCLPGISCAFHLLSNVFLQATPNFRCDVANEISNKTYILPDDGFNISYRNKSITLNETCTWFKDGKSILCKKYIFDDSIYKSTTVTEWNLVCSQAYLTTIGDSMVMFGLMIGSIIFGDLSDRYGRKPIFFISLVAQVISSAAAAVAPNYWIFIACKIVIGASTSAYLMLYVIAMEMVGPSGRLVAGTICQMFFSLGYMLTGGIAYFITEWRYLQIALSLPGILFFSYWWFIPESVRWLLSKNNLKEAIRLIQLAAKENKVEISDAQLETLLTSDISQKDSNEKKQTILNIFKHPYIRNIALITFFNWFVTSCTYYGLSWSTSNLGGNDYINFLISGAVEIPGYSFVLFTLNRWGRKPILCACLVTCGISLLLTSAISKELFWINIILTMIGKLAVTACFGVVYIFATEHFPTVIRNAGIGACSMSARIGGTIAPMINLTNNVWMPFPMVIFGVLTLVAGGLSLLLPETLNQKLPDTISDCEHFFKNTTDNEVCVVEETQVNIASNNEPCKRRY